MNKPKLWILDIDGTCNEAVYQVLQQYQVLGHYITFATGRGYLRTIQALAGFKPNTPLILEDGGRITEVNGENIRLNQLSVNEIFSVKNVLQANKNKIDLAVFYPLESQKLNFLALNDAADTMISKLKTVKGSTTRRIDCFIDLAVSLGCVMITIIAKNESQLILPNTISWAMAAGEYNIHPQGINKASGVRDIASLLNITYQDVVVIGNDDNDISMFEMPVKMKIAVGSNIQLQKLSTHSVKTPDELAKLLNKIKRS